MGGSHAVAAAHRMPPQEMGGAVFETVGTAEIQDAQFYSQISNSERSSYLMETTCTMYKYNETMLYRSPQFTLLPANR